MRRSGAAPRLLVADERPSLAAILGHVARHATEAVITMSADGTITGWNERAAALFGWSADEVVGRELARLIIPRHYRAAHRRGMRRFLMTGATTLVDRKIDITGRHRDGTEIPVELSVTVLREGGAPTFIGFVRDVSGQRAAERALRETEVRFQSLVEQLPGIAYVDEPAQVGRYVSPQVESILGYTPEEWLTDHALWSRILHADDRERTLAALASGEATGGAFTMLYRLVARDGRIVWVRDQATVHRDATGQTTIHGVMFDVTREIGAQAELQLELAERRQISEALQRLPHARPIEETAAAICRELMRLPHADLAMVYEFAHDGSVIPVGQIAPPGAPTHVGEPLPPERASYLRESATGPWIDEWRPHDDDLAYHRAWHRVGLRVAAYVPFGTGDVSHGLLSLGATSPIGATGAARWLPSMTEFGAVAAALLAPAFGSRRAEEGTRAMVTKVIAERAFTPLFQSIVRIGDETVVGYEALTRFADGRPPDQWFAIADTVGMGPQLEEATMRAALRAATKLPPRAWLSINLSPSRLAEGPLPALAGVARRGRTLVLEITERLAIEDYASARLALDRLAGSVDVAVDDAGAGFSSLRHIIELRPRYVKLDLQLVRGVDADPARQALIAGMVYFARDAGCLLIAEGVETVAERDALRRLGVPFAQGFLFGRPAPAAAWRGPGGAGRASAGPEPAAPGHIWGT